VSIHEFGLGSNNGILKKLSLIMNSDSKFVFVRSGLSEPTTLESMLQLVRRSQKILYNHEFFHDLFTTTCEKNSQTDFIEAHQFR
jgi:hypothetical protein